MAERQKKWSTSNEFLRSLHHRLHAAGDRQLYLISADQLIGDDGEATVDALHPTDAGFLRMADVMQPVIRKALGP